MVVFDTNVIVNYFYEDPKAVKLIEKYLDREKIYITIINRYELIKGSKFVETKILNEFLNAFDVYYLDQKSVDISAQIYRQLKEKGKLINDSDILIAGMCISNNEELITMDSEFERINNKNIKVV
ncbi:MAG: PIN domain-containing protein [Candidatus Micrarchaeaceae archaeon]